MDADTGCIRFGPRRCTILIALVASLALMDAAFAAGSTNAQHFTLTGSATLQLDQATQQSGLLSLNAHLTAKDAAIASSPPVQEGSGFALMARLASSPTVCYNDTIFRDDFDGDGG